MPSDVIEYMDILFAMADDGDVLEGQSDGVLCR